MSPDTKENFEKDARHITKCEDIQPLLFDYMNRELGEGFAALVREHLRKCSTCKAAATGIHNTLNLLHAASRIKQPEAEHLSEKHRKKIIRAFTHPIMSWIENHLFLASVTAAAIFSGGVLLLYGWLIQNRLAPLVDQDDENKAAIVVLISPGQTNVAKGTNVVIKADGK